MLSKRQKRDAELLYRIQARSALLHKCVQMPEYAEVRLGNPYDFLPDTLVAPREPQGPTLYVEHGTIDGPVFAVCRINFCPFCRERLMLEPGKRVMGGIFASQPFSQGEGG